MGLRGYIVKRLIYTLFLIVFVLALNFIIFEVMPGSPLDLFVGTRGFASLTTEQREKKIESVMHQWGLDQPWYIRFGTYMQRMLLWDFGETSPNTGNQPIIKYIMEPYLPNTLILMGISTVFSIVIGVILGVIAAYKRGGLFDGAVVLTSLITFSLPTFWMGLMFINIFRGILPAGRVGTEALLMPPPSNFFVLGTQIIFPSMFEVQDRLVHLILPTLTLTLFQYGNYLLLTRATMLETLTEDYIMTAKAKGLNERTIIFKHALKNASLPIITSSALAFGFLIGGAMITETVFSYPGIGRLTLDSIFITMNYPVLHVIFYITALCVIIANFISDLLYGIIDPRIKYG
jgi:peptide/nickel transport system permease protein